MEKSFFKSTENGFATLSSPSKSAVSSWAAAAAPTPLPSTFSLPRGLDSLSAFPSPPSSSSFTSSSAAAAAFPQPTHLFGDIDRSRYAKKRTSNDDSADDILSQICSKMSSMSTTDDSKQQNLVSAFIAVLECSPEEAVFFLESSLWDIEAAVLLWLDTGKGDYSKRSKAAADASSKRSGGGSGSGSGSSSGGGVGLGGSSFEASKAVPRRHVHTSLHSTAPRYEKKQVVIPDLDPEWSAWVSRSSGSVYFLHNATGHTQGAVPPGYADYEEPPSVKMKKQQREKMDDGEDEAEEEEEGGGEDCDERKDRKRWEDYIDTMTMKSGYDGAEDYRGGAGVGAGSRTGVDDVQCDSDSDCMVQEAFPVAEVMAVAVALPTRPLRVSSSTAFSLLQDSSAVTFVSESVRDRSDGSGVDRFLDDRRQCDLDDEDPSSSSTSTNSSESHSQSVLPSDASGWGSMDGEGLP